MMKLFECIEFEKNNTELVVLNNELDDYIERICIFFENKSIQANWPILIGAIALRHTVNLILARWNDNSCRRVCESAVNANFEAGYTLNNGIGTSGMRWPKMLRIHIWKIEITEI